MTKEELERKIAEARKNSDVLSQDQIDELLKAIEAGKEDYSPVRDRCRIKIYDFRRPDKFSKQEIRVVSCVAEAYARNLKRFLTCEYDINAKIHVDSVDQLMFEEHIRALPTPHPFGTFKWGEGAGMFSVNPALFYKGFLNSQIKTKHDLNGLEQKIFIEHIYKPFEKILYTTFSNEAAAPLPQITDAKYECNPQFALGVSNPTGMGVLISFVVKIGKGEDYINIFFNANFIESLRKTAFFTTGNESNFVPLANPEPNTIVEAGRFRLEDGDALKEKYIYELNQLAGSPLHVYKDGKHVGDGEAVVIDDNSGARIVTNPDKIEEIEDDGFYNAKAVFGGTITPDDYKFDEGSILELNEYIGEPIKIVRGGKLIGWGELVVVDENFAVKVTKVI